MYSVGRSKKNVVFSFREPETESKLSRHPCMPGLAFLGPERELGPPH